MPTTDIISEYLEEKLLEHLFRNNPYTPPANIYLALYTSDPTDAGTGTEVATIIGGEDTGYQRAISGSFTVSGNSASAASSTSFVRATKSWGTITHMGIMDASTGGNLLFHGSLLNPLLINKDENAIIDSLAITLSGDGNGGWGSGITSSILDFVLNNNAFSSPGLSVYIGLGRSIYTDNDFNLLSWSEINASGYLRKQIAGTAWSSVRDGVITNVDQLSFTDNAPANWGTITHVALFNSSTASNAFLVWGKLAHSKAILLGDGLLFSSRDISVSLF